MRSFFHVVTSNETTLTGGMVYSIIQYHDANKFGREATGLKTKTIVHKSAAPIYAAAVMWLLYGLLFPLYQVGHFLLAAVASAVVAIVARLFCRDVTEEVEIPEEPVTTGNPELDKMIADGNGAIKTMRALNDSIQDETVSGQIDRLEEVSGRIFAYVKGEPGEAAPNTQVHVLLPAHHHQAAAEL